MVDVFAYQEALLIEAIFGIAILAMLWAGFRRWLRHKEETSRLIAEQSAALAGQHGAHMARVEARLKALEGIVMDGRALPAGQIDALRSDPLPEPILERGQAQGPGFGRGRRLLSAMDGKRTFA
jgi:hypothetical protein